MRRVHLVLLIGFWSLAATAAEPESRQLPGITKWQGPFKETLIVKYADYSDGVACYVYIPKSVGSSLNCEQIPCSTNFSGDIGSISCVKVAEKQDKKK